MLLMQTRKGVWVMGIVTQAFGPLLFLVMGVALIVRGMYPRARGQYKTADPDSRAHWRRLRAGQCTGVAYGDLRRRRLDDYRSSLLLLLPVLLLAATAWATLSLLPTFGGQLYIEPVGYERIRIPYQPLVLALLPTAMVVVVTMAEVIMRRIVALPRLLVTADPAAALHADEMIRALAITVVQSSMLETLAFLGYAQWSLLSDNLFAHHSYGAAHGIVGSYPFLALVVFLLGVLLTNCRGRIGGRITGWPRQGTRVAL